MNAADTETSSEKAAEILRLTLPLMSRQGVPATPKNYAVWYAHVAGDNPELSSEIERLRAAEQKFSPAINDRLYRDFIAEHDLTEVEQVRSDLSAVITEVGHTLTGADKDAYKFASVLGGFADNLSQSGDLHNIRGLLGELIEETRSMRASTNSIQAHFEEKSKQVETLQEQLHAERIRAVTDPLTGLFNRFALFEKLEQDIEEMTDNAPPSVIMFDIDHFKKINDTHGHLIGDRVIRFVAQTLQRNIKGQDTAARFGGEEFTVVLPATPINGALAVAEKIRKVVEVAQLVRADTKQPLENITISAGVSLYRHGEDLMDFIDRADRALYKSKNDGRNRVTVST